jgi:hypothetical protein
MQQQKTDPTFLKIEHRLLMSQNIDLLSKLIIARILSFQSNNLKYFESSSQIGKTFGVPKKNVSYRITGLKKLPFIKVKVVGNFNNRGKTRFISINTEDLNKFLIQEVENRPEEQTKPEQKLPNSSLNKKLQPAQQESSMEMKLTAFISENRAVYMEGIGRSGRTNTRLLELAKQNDLKLIIDELEQFSFSSNLIFLLTDFCDKG